MASQVVDIGDIFLFDQQEGEPFHEAFDQFQELVRSCPNHGFRHHHTLMIFFEGLLRSYQDLLDTFIEGEFPEKYLNKACQLVEKIAADSYEDVVNHINCMMSYIQGTEIHPRYGNTWDNPKTPKIRKKLEVTLKALCNTRLKNEEVQ